MRKNDWQLIVFTLLVQMSVGIFILFCGSYLFQYTRNLMTQRYFYTTILFSLLILILSGMIVLTHVGKPLRSIFALLNIRSSWLSREVLMTTFFGLILLIISLRARFLNDISTLDQILFGLGTILGIFLIYSISRLYMLRTVPTWNSLRTPLTFYLSSFLLGSVALITVLGYQESDNSEMLYDAFLMYGFWVIFGIIGMQLMISIFSFLAQAKSRRYEEGPNRVFQVGNQWLLGFRWGFTFLGLSIFSSLLFSNADNQTWTLIAMFLIFFSEIMGRIIFFWQYQRVGY